MISKKNIRSEIKAQHPDMDPDDLERSTIRTWRWRSSNLYEMNPEFCRKTPKEMISDIDCDEVALKRMRAFLTRGASVMILHDEAYKLSVALAKTLCFTCSLQPYRVTGSDLLTSEFEMPLHGTLLLDLRISPDDGRIFSELQILGSTRLEMFSGPKIVFLNGRSRGPLIELVKKWMDFSEIYRHVKYASWLEGVGTSQDVPGEV